MEDIGSYVQVNKYSSKYLFKNNIGHKVYTNRNSLVGSIGVVSMPVNFKKLFDETKIKRNLITTSDKLMEYRFDPLRDDYLNPKDVEFMHWMMDEIFVDFKDHVKQHR